MKTFEVLEIIVSEEYGEEFYSFYFEHKAFADKILKLALKSQKTFLEKGIQKYNDNYYLAIDKIKNSSPTIELQDDFIKIIDLLNSGWVVEIKPTTITIH